MGHFASPDWSTPCGLVNKSTDVLSTIESIWAEGDVTSSLYSYTAPRTGLVRFAYYIVPITGTTNAGAVPAYNFSISGISPNDKQIEIPETLSTSLNNSTFTTGVHSGEGCFHVKNGQSVGLNFVATGASQANAGSITFRLTIKILMD